jgi:hypothetical protein
MAIPGKWQLNFDWGSVGSYQTTDLEFDSNGTWKLSDETLEGRWAHVEGLLLLNITGLSTVFTGLVASNSVTGNMTTFGGVNGSWYMLKTDASAAAKQGGGDLDMAGRPLKV